MNWDIDFKPAIFYNVIVLISALNQSDKKHLLYQYSFVPEDDLERIGVEPSVKRNLILADGRQDTRLLGFCNFQIEGLEGIIPCPVIFAPKGSLFLLGATALENFGVDADPIQKRLKPILAIIGGFLASQ